jgi:hypothetical protein
MAKTPLVAARTPVSLPAANDTRKDQKGYQLPDEYNAQLVNQEFDRVHERLNKLAVEGAHLTDLVTDGTATNAEICTQLNALAELLRQSGLLRRS